MDDTQYPRDNLESLHCADVYKKDFILGTHLHLCANIGIRGIGREIRVIIDMSDNFQLAIIAVEIILRGVIWNSYV